MKKYIEHYEFRSLLATLVVVWGGICSAAVIEVTAYGAMGDGVSDDTTAIRNAVSALTANDVLVFPKPGNFYLVSDHARFAINDDGTRVVLQGKIKTSGTPVPGDYVFYVSAANCEFTGETEQAIIEGSDNYYTAVDDTNGPSLIKLSGSATNCRISNVRFVNAPHFGVCINGAANVTIRGCTFEGGPVSAAGGQLQAVFFIGANSLCIKNNHFRPGVGNGKMHQWIGAGSTTHSNYVTISGNTFESSFNCSANMSGVSHSNITGNISKDACAVAFQIISGVGNVIANNTIDNAAGGGFCLAGAQRCIVSGNVLNQVGFIGIEISPYGGDLGSYTNNLIIKNSIKGAASGTVYEGIRVYSAGGTVSGTRVDDNTITGMGLSSGRAAISLQAGAASYSCVVTSNIIDQCGNGGIEFIRINRSMYAHNVTAVVTGKTCFTESYVTEANTKTDNIEKVY